VHCHPAVGGGVPVLRRGAAAGGGASLGGARGHGLWGAFAPGPAGTGDQDDLYRAITDAALADQRWLRRPALAAAEAAPDLGRGPGGAGGAVVGGPASAGLAVGGAAGRGVGAGRGGGRGIRAGRGGVPGLAVGAAAGPAGGDLGGGGLLAGRGA